MRTVIFLFCFCSVQYVFSQTNNRKVSVTGSSAILFRSLAFQPGFQYTSKNWAGLGEVSLLSAKKLDFHKGYWFRFQTEVKKFLNKDEVRFYISFQTAYSARKFVTNDSGSFYSGKYLDTGAIYSNATIHSPILSFAPKFGYEVSISKTIFLDIFNGVGVRMIFNRYDARNIRPAKFFHGFRDWDFLTKESWRFNTTLVRFHLVTGLRLGYRF